MIDLVSLLNNLKFSSKQGRRVGWHTGAAVPPNQKKKKEENFLHFIFFAFFH